MAGSVISGGSRVRSTPSSRLGGAMPKLGGEGSEAPARLGEPFMTTHPEDPSQMVTAQITLGGGDWQLQARVTVPAGPARLRDLLPLARSLSDAVVGAAVQAVAQAGAPISCK